MSRKLFDCYSQSFISARETGHYAMSLPKFEIFLTFLDFSRILSYLANCETARAIDIKIRFTCAK